MPLEVFTEVEIYWKKAKWRFVPPVGGLRGNVHGVRLWLVGKHVVDFLLVLIELFRQLSRLRRYERILVAIVVFERGWVTLSANFRGKGVVHQRVLASEN